MLALGCLFFHYCTSWYHRHRARGRNQTFWSLTMRCIEPLRHSRQFSHWMSFPTGKWKWFLIGYMIVYCSMNLTSTLANVIVLFVSCLSLIINSLPKFFVGWFNTLGTPVTIQTIIQDYSKLSAKCVFPLTLQYAPCLYAMWLHSCAAAGVPNHYVLIIFSWTITFTDFCVRTLVLYNDINDNMKNFQCSIGW